MFMKIIVIIRLENYQRESWSRFVRRVRTSPVSAALQRGDGGEVTQAVARVANCCNLRECRISGEEAAYRDASCTTSFPWRAWIFLERGGRRDRENTRWLKVWTTFEQRKEEAKGTFLRDDTFKFLLNRPLFNFIRFHLLRGMIFSFFPFLRRLTQEDGDWIEVLKAGWWKDFDIEFFSFFFLSSLYYRLAARFTEESFVSSLKRFEFDE